MVGINPRIMRGRKIVRRFKWDQCYKVKLDNSDTHKIETVEWERKTNQIKKAMNIFFEDTCSSSWSIVKRDKHLWDEKLEKMRVKVRRLFDQARRHGLWEEYHYRVIRRRLKRAKGNNGKTFAMQ